MVQASGGNTYGVAKYVVSADLTQGNYSTIQAAITAASSGDTVFLRNGTYTENLTLKAGVNLSALPSDASGNATGKVIISGTCTMTTAGSVTISSIQLQTNAAAFLAVTGTLASVVNLDHCYLYCLNATGITYSSSSTSSKIRITNCRGDIGTTLISLFTSTGAGSIQTEYTDFVNNGSSVTASTTSVSSCSFNFCTLAFPLSATGTGTFSVIHTIIASISNTTAFTTAGTGGAHTTAYSNFESGTASAISIGTGTTLKMQACSVTSSNTNAITGAGTLTYSNIMFAGTSSLINTTTQTAAYTNLGKYKASGQPSFFAINSASDANVTGDGTTYTIICDSEIYDQDSNYNTGTGTFTAPVAGRYMFSGNVSMEGMTSTTFDCRFRIVASNRRVDFFLNSAIVTGAAALLTLSGCSFVDMDAADTCTLVVICGNGTKIIDVSGEATAAVTSFGGQLMA